MGRRVALRGPAIHDLTQSTVFVQHDTFFALGVGLPSQDIAVKYPVSPTQHPLPDAPSRSPKEYEATGYRLFKDLLLTDVVDALCALDLKGGELGGNSPSGPQPRGGRRQMAPGTLDKWHPLALRWRLLHILADLFHLFPVLRDLEDKEPRLVEWTQPAPWRGFQWPHYEFMLTLRGAADTKVVFVSLQDDAQKVLAHCTGDEPWLPHVQHMAHGSTKVCGFVWVCVWVSICVCMWGDQGRGKRASYTLVTPGHPIRFFLK